MLVRTALAVLLALPCAAADVPLERGLHGVSLGDTLWRVKKRFPPRGDWPKLKDLEAGLTRLELDRENAKSFSPDVEKMRLGFSWGTLSYLQVIYTKDHSKRRTLEKVVKDFAINYGEPRRAGETFFWRDWRTAVRVSQVGLPTGKKGALELRTSIEVMTRSVFDPRG